MQCLALQACSRYGDGELTPVPSATVNEISRRAGHGGAPRGPVAQTDRSAPVLGRSSVHPLRTLQNSRVRRLLFYILRPRTGALRGFGQHVLNTAPDGSTGRLASAGVWKIGRGVPVDPHLSDGIMVCRGAPVPRRMGLSCDQHPFSFSFRQEDTASSDDDIG